MEQIIFLVGAIVLNLVLKSIQDKKKMEEARNKRISGNNSTTTRAESQPVMKKAKEPSLIQ